MTLAPERGPSSSLNVSMLDLARKQVYDQSMKRCSRCEETKDFSCFRKNARYLDGHHSWCIDCSKQYRKDQYQANKEKEKKQHKDWVSNNRERRSAQNVAATKKWQENNKEKVTHWKTDNKHRRREIYATGSLTLDEWVEVCNKFGNKCLKCGENEVTIDHVVPLSKGGTHSMDNVQPLCRSCNSTKHDKTIDYRSQS